MRRLPSIGGLLAGALVGASLTFASWGGAQASEALTVDEVKRIIAQAVQEAQTRGVFASIAVSDRVGNILGLYEMEDGVAGLRSMAITSDISNPDGAVGKPNINQGRSSRERSRPGPRRLARALSHRGNRQGDYRGVSVLGR